MLSGSVGRVLHDRARGIDPRGLEHQTQRISISVENTFERDLTDRAQLHAELRRMADRLSELLRGSGRTARTVSTKLRYTDFSIRTRSTSLRVGIDEPAKIGELACALLDRALAELEALLPRFGGLVQDARVVGADAGRTMRVRVTATNADGSASAQSEQTAAITPA